ncbi:hypothetical protein DBV15_09616 [Temnothorax longispinosus]|uniref:Uncharacterized protein n=1 Tax=Temnothorax longispinosus TaxID=300112 RepID=A0A4S2LDN3_9HYME|nr:hypothetical protein DBV15_09616 [Temnothorax longispinosus]
MRSRLGREHIWPGPRSVFMPATQPQPRDFASAAGCSLLRAYCGFSGLSSFRLSLFRRRDAAGAVRILPWIAINRSAVMAGTYVRDSSAVIRRASPKEAP